MRNRKKQVLSAVLVAAGGMGVASPAFACHEPTGWCCNEIGSKYYCCYWQDDKIQTNTCGWIEPV